MKTPFVFLSRFVVLATISTAACCQAAAALNAAAQSVTDANANQAEAKAKAVAQLNTAVENGTDSPTVQGAAGAVTDDDLRKMGLSFGAGYDYLFDTRQYAKTVQVKYNFFQADTDTLALLKPKNRSLFATPYKMIGATVTSLNGFMGYSVASINSRKTPGKSESPLLLGLSLGLGVNPQRSSNIYLDAGVALFNTADFKRQDAFVGVSLDPAVLAVLLKGLTAGK